MQFYLSLKISSMICMYFHRGTCMLLMKKMSEQLHRRCYLRMSNMSQLSWTRRYSHGPMDFDLKDSPFDSVAPAHSRHCHHDSMNSEELNFASARIYMQRLVLWTGVQLVVGHSRSHHQRLGPRINNSNLG